MGTQYLYAMYDRLMGCNFDNKNLHLCSKWSFIKTYYGCKRAIASEILSCLQFDDKESQAISEHL